VKKAIPTQMHIIWCKHAQNHLNRLAIGIQNNPICNYSIH